MFGPTIKATFDRGRGDGPVELELTYPKNEDEAARHLVEWFGDNEVRRCLSRQYPFVLSSELEWFRSAANDQSGLGWQIHADGTHIGSVGLCGIEYVHSRAELGIIIGDKSFWGKGIATVSEMLVADYSFSNIVAGGLNKLVARVMVGNHASQRALQTVGFREAGVWRRHLWANGQWYDVWLCELLREEWLENREQRLEAAGVLELDICPA